ncbi:uncharacterized protein LOC127004274 [Eriocheir sinensis]|uniref:uncharacterized protein LOC127004274 n=1 Tax=Eriocheir sinensis TaxID=95602 RepID=UPI0021C94F58|nr:uncharacterized protein LOC127004274 [Eriocheir sinensis]
MRMRRGVKFFPVLSLVLLVTMTAAMQATTRTEATITTTTSPPTTTTKTQNTEGLEASLQKEEKQKIDGETKSDVLRFFGSFSTTTRTMLLMMTSTVPLTCLSSANTGTTCAGRRRRKRSHSLLKDVGDDGEGKSHADLDGSVVESIDSLRSITTTDDDTEDSRKLLGINFFTTSLTTTSVTVFFTDTRTTLRIAFLCTAAALIPPERFCVGLERCAARLHGQTGGGSSHAQADDNEHLVTSGGYLLAKACPTRDQAVMHESLMLLMVAVMLAALGTAAEAGSEEVTERVAVKVVGEGILSSRDVENTHLVQKGTEMDRIFAGGYSTTSETVVAMVTSTVFFSCIEGTSTSLCNGRRKRKAHRSSLYHIEEDASYSALEGSHRDLAREMRELKDLVYLDPEEEQEDDLAMSKLLGFTLWTRARTTSTVTMLFTDTNTTIRLSYYCQAGGLQMPEFPCQPTPPLEPRSGRSSN